MPRQRSAVLPPVPDRAGDPLSNAAAGDSPQPAWREHVVATEDEGRSVADVLAAAFGAADGEVGRLARAGRIRLNRRGASPGRRVRAGDVVALRVAEEALPAGPEPVPMALSIAYEDADLLVVDKPAGVLVHPVVAGGRDTLVNGVAHHLLRRGAGGTVHPVHRLDRDTSGLVLFATSPGVHARLEGQLRSRALRRGYLALADGTVAANEGEIDAPVGRDPLHPSRRAVVPGGQPARTRVRVVERFPGATLLRLELETGRTHQVRVHLLHAGHPVLGDPWYGRRGLDRIARQALHAADLRFLHPATGDAVEVRAPLPADMARLLRALRTGDAG